MLTRRESSESLDRTKARKKSLSRKYERSNSVLLADEKLPRESDEVVEELVTEDYWFICKRWLARSEDDGKIVRELIATDESGKPLVGGLQGKNI